MNRKNLLAMSVLFLISLVLPWVIAVYPLGIVIEILIYGIFASSLNLLLGYSGLVSFGHAAFFGIGAYTASIFAQNVSANIFFTLPAAVIVSLLAALIIGFFCTRVSGFYFLMLTLAFAQMIYAIAHQWESLTGGSNGLSGIPVPQLWSGFSFEDQKLLYYLILIVFLLVIFGIRRFIASPVGQTLIGIRENEGRLKAIGYNIRNYKLLAFVIAGGLGGVAGALYSYFNGFVSPHEVYWTVSGHAIIMVIIGGAGTLIGPTLGAGFLIILQSVVSSYTDRWYSIVGLTFIAFVLFAPKGIMGLISLLKLPGKKEVTQNFNVEGEKA
ncbi:MAG: branched-chain amino acid ABC transporter permease [Clostridia bacterium]|nr:branched-chain amino acid ABC transporter permease [Clostridia bacterium]